MSDNAPAGWYMTEEGRQYWDGTGWAQHAQPPRRRPVNKVLHLTLSIVTLGAWIPIWTLILLSRLSDEQA